MRESSDSVRGDTCPADHPLAHPLNPAVRQGRSGRSQPWDREWDAPGEFPFDARSFAEFEQFALELLATIDMAFDELERTKGR